jgi:hypothetical protein
MKLKIYLLPLLLSLLLSACGQTDVNTSNSVSDQVLTVPSIGTNGKLIAIQSSNVKAAGYNEDLMVMTVQFKNGALYEYYGVLPELWVSFVAAQPNPWSQVGYPRLVEAGVPYKRVG